MQATHAMYKIRQSTSPIIEQIKPAVAMPLPSGFFRPIAPNIIPRMAKIAPSQPNDPAENSPITKAKIPSTREATPMLNLLKIE